MDLIENEWRDVWYNNMCDMNLQNVAHNEFFTEELYNKYPNYDYDWSYISQRRSLSCEFIRQNIDKPWDFKRLSRNKNITTELLSSFISLDWDWAYLGNHPNMTREFIIQHSTKSWNWQCMHEFHIFTIEIPLALPDKSWSWNMISYYCKNNIGNHSTKSRIAVELAIH